MVKQTPADVLVFSGGTVVISCSHNIKDYDRMNWYKQSDKELQLQGYMNFENGYPMKGLRVKISGSALRGMTCNLTLEWLNVNSSAVYYCASSVHTPMCLAAHKHKNLKMQLVGASLPVSSVRLGVCSLARCQPF